MRISDWSSDVCSSDLSREWIQSRRAPLRARWGKPPSSAADEWLFTSECEDLGEGGACLTGQFCGRPRASSRRLIAGEIGARRLGKACVSTCRSRWSPVHKQTQKPPYRITK